MNFNLNNLSVLLAKINNSKDLNSAEKDLLNELIGKELTILEKSQLNSITVSSGSCACCGK